MADEYDKLTNAIGVILATPLDEMPPPTVDVAASRGARPHASGAAGPQSSR
jgi:hypothetical protein